MYSFTKRLNKKGDKMKNRIIYTLLLTVLLYVLPLTSVYASESVEEGTVVTETITVGGITMTVDEYEDFMVKLDACDTEEDIYSLYQSMGMDTSSLDNAFSGSLETSESETEDNTDNTDHVDSNVDSMSTSVIENNEEETDNSVETNVEPGEKNDDNENAGEFTYEYDNSKGTTVIKAVASVVGAVTVGLVGYIVVMKKKKDKK